MLGYEPAFGYLAIITALVMPFVVPTMKRCEAETMSNDQFHRTVVAAHDVGVDGGTDDGGL